MSSQDLAAALAAWGLRPQTGPSASRRRCATWPSTRWRSIGLVRPSPRTSPRSYAPSVSRWFVGRARRPFTVRARMDARGRARLQAAQLSSGGCLKSAGCGPRPRLPALARCVARAGCGRNRGGRSGPLPTLTLAAMRTCQSPYCDRPLLGMRPQARFCSGACRAVASRARREGIAETPAAPLAEKTSDDFWASLGGRPRQRPAVRGEGVGKGIGLAGGSKPHTSARCTSVRLSRGDVAPQSARVAPDARTGCFVSTANTLPGHATARRTTSGARGVAASHRPRGQHRRPGAE